MEAIYADNEIIEMCAESSVQYVILWGWGRLGKTVYKEILSEENRDSIIIWDSSQNQGNIFSPYTLHEYINRKNALVIICIGNRVVAEQKKKECIEKGFRTVLAIDHGYQDSILKLPAIEFSLNMGCSLNCRYCPQDVLIHAYKDKISDKIQRHITFNEFKKILSNELNPCAMVSFSGMSEPFENPEAIEMMLYAHAHGFRMHLNTTLMGLTYESYNKIKDIDFEGIYLHVPDEEGFSKFKISDEYCIVLTDFIENFKDKIEFISVHSPNISKRVKDVVESSGIAVYDASNFYDRAGNLDILNKHINKSGFLFCNMPANSYCSQVVIPSGKLALCCDDYSIEGVGGNILEQSWKEILVHEDYGKLRIGIDNENWPCKKCCHSKDIVHTLQKYPDFAYEKINSYYVYNIVKNYRSMFREEYKVFFERQILLYGVNNSKWSYYFFDNCWKEIFDVHGFIGEENKTGVTNIAGVSWVEMNDCIEKNIPILVLTENETDVETLRRKGYQNVALFKDVSLSYIS